MKFSTYWNRRVIVMANLSLRLAHMLFCWFCHEAAQNMIFFFFFDKSQVPGQHAHCHSPVGYTYVDSNYPAHYHSLNTVFVGCSSDNLESTASSVGQCRLWSDFENLHTNVSLRIRYEGSFTPSDVCIIIKNLIQADTLEQTVYNNSSFLFWPGLEVIKSFSCSTQLSMKCSTAYKHGIANNSWYFNIHLQRNFYAQHCLIRKNLQLLVILDLLAAKQISCSTELSMKKVL